MKNNKYIFFALIFYLVSLLAACSGGSDSDDEIASGESLYEPGASVSAVGFNDAYKLEIGILNENNEFFLISDGQYINPGVKKLAVKIEGDPLNINKVLASDGGIYQVEVKENNGLYIFDFNFKEDRIYQCILIQVIHNNGKATKEKIVFNTSNPNIDGEYQLNGAHVFLTQEIIEGQKKILADWLDTYIKQVFKQILDKNPKIITELSYGDNNPDTSDIEIITFECIDSVQYPSTVLHITFMIKDVSLASLNLYGQDLISTNNNDVTVDFYLALYNDTNDEGKKLLYLDFSESANVLFDQDFLLKGFIEGILEYNLTSISLPPVSLDLALIRDNLNDRMPGTISLNGKDIDTNALFDKLNINLEKYLFIDLYGIPDETTNDNLALGLGMYISDYEEINWESHNDQSTPSQNNDLEIGLNGLFETMTDKMFDDIKQEYDGIIVELSYGDEAPDTSNVMINSLEINNSTNKASVNFTIKNVDLKAISLLGFSLISTQDNDLTIDSTFDLIRNGDVANNQLVLDIQDVTLVKFSKYFIGKTVVEELVKNKLKGIENDTLNIEDLLKSLDFTIDLSRCFSSEKEFPIFPDISPYTSQSSWEVSILEPYNVSCAISQDNINMILGKIINKETQWDVNELVKALLGETFVGFSSDRKEDEQTIMNYSVPPVIDLSSEQIRIQANDVRLQYRIKSEPQWEASVDLDLVVDIRAGKDTVDFYLNVIPENTHFHIMRDNNGNLGIFDHSGLVYDIIKGLPEMLGGTPGDPVISVGIDYFEPDIVFKDIANPVSVSVKGEYIYLDMAAESIDLSQILSWIYGPFN